MKKGQNLKWILGGMWLTLGSVMLAQPGWGQAATPVEDKAVKTSIYFPMPHMSYNTIYLGKKLDIGILQPFRVNLGSAECDGTSTLVGTGAELPSLWLPRVDPDGNEGTPTPLFLRSSLPGGGIAGGQLNITGLNAPILVKELEVGSRSFEGERGTSGFKLKIPETAMGSASVSLPNLLLGDEDDSVSEIPEFGNLTVNANSTVANFYLGGSSSVAIGPSLPDDCPAGETIHWEKVKFGGSTLTALVCGQGKPEPFESHYQCPLNGNNIWCNLNSSETALFCDVESSGCPSTLYRWTTNDSGSIALTAKAHKNYCDALVGSVPPMPILLEAALDAMGSTPQCGDTDISGNWGENSGPSQCFVVKMNQIDTSSIPCVEPYTGVPNLIPYDMYFREIDDFWSCNDYCESFY